MPERNEVLGHFGSTFSRPKAHKGKGVDRYLGGTELVEARREEGVHSTYLIGLPSDERLDEPNTWVIWRQVGVLIRRYYKCMERSVCT